MVTMKVKLIAVTQPVSEMQELGAKGPEDIVSYCARVSNPSNQGNFDTGERLLNYCVRNRHWSIFQMVNALVEVEGPRDITRQFTRHESIVVIETEAGDYSVRPDGFDAKAGGIQEFSQRYSSDIGFVDYREPRLQDTKNRQNSISLTSEEAEDIKSDWDGDIRFVKEYSGVIYNQLTEGGVAKECARVFLPEGLTMSRLYANGTLRSWLHYLDVREGNGTQKEHVELAGLIRQALEPVFPLVMGLTREGFPNGV